MALNVLLQWQKFARMIKFSHTVFALPFAPVAVALVYRFSELHLSWKHLFLIVLAFTGMRSFAMAFNRIVDARIDALNPRTARREIPAGELSMRQAWFFAILALLLVWASAWFLTPLAFFLSFPALVVVAGYSYAKRFTFFCHLWLGVAIGLAPLGVYLALAQSLPLEAWLLFLILSTYIAGFDILYSLQDMEFDAAQGLHSVPVRFGVTGALLISSLFHLLTMAGFFLLAWWLPLGPVYRVGAVILSLLVVGEHLVVGWGSKVRLEKVPMAFLHFNSAISLLFLLFVLLDFWG